MSGSHTSRKERLFWICLQRGGGELGWRPQPLPCRVLFSLGSLLLLSLLRPLLFLTQ